MSVSLCLSLVLASSAYAQTNTGDKRAQAFIGLGAGAPAVSVQRPVVAPTQVAAGPDYRIGPDDQISISVLQAPELATTMRVSQEGLISLPLVGAMKAGGLTTIELKHAIEEQLSRKYIKEPDVTVQITDARSHSVSVVGAVQRPGVVQLTGPATLLEVISLAGGLAPDAGDVVVVVHKAEDGAAGRTEELKLKTLLDSPDSNLNVPIYPGDVIKVRAADVVYVVGAVNKPGAYAMQGNDRLTVLRALALGGGVTGVASQGKAIVVRAGARGERVEIPVDLKAVFKGKKPDVTLEAHDLLFVPTSGSKQAGRATLDAISRVLSVRPVI